MRRGGREHKSLVRFFRVLARVANIHNLIMQTHIPSPLFSLIFNDHLRAVHRHYFYADRRLYRVSVRYTRQQRAALPLHATLDCFFASLQAQPALSRPSESETTGLAPAPTIPGQPRNIGHGAVGSQGKPSSGLKTRSWVNTDCAVL